MTRDEFFKTLFGASFVANSDTDAIAKDLGLVGQEKRLIALEMSCRFRSQEDLMRFKADLEPFEKEFNCRFLILDAGISAKTLLPVQPKRVVVTVNATESTAADIARQVEQRIGAHI